MRVLGIASGVLLSELAAVLIFPRSATQVRWPGPIPHAWLFRLLKQMGGAILWRRKLSPKWGWHYRSWLSSVTLCGCMGQPCTPPRRPPRLRERLLHASISPTPRAVLASHTLGVACRRADGYTSLPDNDIEDARMADFEKAQERFEEESEKLLMAVYDALYKVSWARVMDAQILLCCRHLIHGSGL